MKIYEKNSNLECVSLVSCMCKQLLKKQLREILKQKQSLYVFMYKNIERKESKSKRMIK